MQRFLNALPGPPDYRYDWAALDGLTGLHNLLADMARTPQNPKWHGEGDVLTHTRLVCEALCGLPAFRELPEKPRQMLAAAALLHDAGKAKRTRLDADELVSPGHAASGSRLVRELLWTEYGLSGEMEGRRFRETVCWLIRHHGVPPHLLREEEPETHLLRMAADGELLPEATLHLLCLLAEADALGRVAPDVQDMRDRVLLCAELAAELGCLDGPYPFADAHTERALFRGARVWRDQRLWDDSWGEVIVLCGLPGTGKDTWAARQHLPQVSLDALRARWPGNVGDEEQGAIAHAARDEAKEYLRAHQPFIWNATSLTARRERVIRLCEDYGARVRLVWLETTWPENLRRNAARKAAVPEHVICGMLHRLEPPARWEAQTVEWVCV